MEDSLFVFAEANFLFWSGVGSAVNALGRGVEAIRQGLSYGAENQRGGESSDLEKKQSEDKIMQMERELADLKEMLQKIAVGRSEHEQKKDFQENSMNQLHLKDSGKAENVFKNSDVPPPPPAPPLPFLMDLSKLKVQCENKSKEEKENKEDVNDTHSSSTNAAVDLNQKMQNGNWEEKKKKIYTRRIEADSFEHAIRISSKLKLRKTDISRSPGGTPIKAPISATKEIESEILRHKLFQKFQNAFKEDSQDTVEPETHDDWC